MTPPGAATAVLVPIKAFTAAKARLSHAVGATERADLARRMAAAVLAAADPLPVWVVCDDEEVAAWAAAHGARVCWRPAAGLNEAVTAGVAFLAAEGVERVVVAHADLPRARSLAELAGGDPASVVIVPDRHRQGSNVVVVPTGGGFRFAYGPGSLAAHSAEAARLGLALHVIDDPDLAWDVDEPEDLAALDPLSVPGDGATP